MQPFLKAPKYEFVETGATCPHGSPDCLCDVTITTPTPIIVGPHQFHDEALDLADGLVLDARNFYEYAQYRLGMFESVGRIKPCSMCGKDMVVLHQHRDTCSDACRMKKSRVLRKAKEKASI
jgi:hypothetical protein